MKSTVLIGTAVLLCLLATSAQATTYFEESFESLTVGSAITSGATSSGNGSWNISLPGGTSFLKVVADPAGGGGKCMHLYDTVATGFSSIAAVLNPSATESVVFSYDMYMPQWPAVNTLASYISSATNRLTYSLNNTGNNATVGSVTNYGNSLTVNTVLSSALPVNTWIHYEIVVPAMPQSGIFTFHETITAGSTTYFDGDLTSCWNISASSLYELLFTQTSAGAYSYLYLDNVRVATVPEPATVSLLVIGGLLGLVQKQRRS